LAAARGLVAADPGLARGLAAVVVAVAVVQVGLAGLAGGLAAVVIAVAVVQVGLAALQGLQLVEGGAGLAALAVAVAVAVAVQLAGCFPPSQGQAAVAAAVQEAGGSPS